MKYIIFELETKDKAITILPVIFSEQLVHSHMAVAMNTMVKSYKVEGQYLVAVSAGFYNLVTGVCHGKSESMKLESRPEDTNLVNMNQYFPFKPSQ